MIIEIKHQNKIIVKKKEYYSLYANCLNYV